MREIEIRSSHQSTSRVLVGESIANLSQYLPTSSSVILLVDEQVEKLYGKELPDYPLLTIPVGEGSKSLQMLEQLAVRLLELNADRGTFLVGVGGGVTCDITGFLASVYMRGVRFGFVSTTLLSQVDASVGGKNGVNLKGYKNILGTFSQPEFVICDTAMLQTLADRDFNAGLAELVKTALIADAQLFATVENSVESILQRNSNLLSQFVLRSVEIKADIVSRDERESGERRKLNLGHTFAHAIERYGGYNHGEAVAIGLVIASCISAKLGLIDEALVNRIEKLLTELGLPVKAAVEKSELLNTVLKDKKRQGDSIHFVLLTGVGSVEVRALPFVQLQELL